jgi:hypothetical protein
MSKASSKDRSEWQRQWEYADSIGILFAEEDNESPKALDASDRRALRAVLRIIAESDLVFRTALKSGQLNRWTERTEHLCDSIESGLALFATIKQSAGIIRGVVVSKRSGSLRSMLAEHGRLFKRLQKEGLGLPVRLSLVLQLVRIELIFFAHMW